MRGRERACVTGNEGGRKEVKRGRGGEGGEGGSCVIYIIAQ